MLFGYFSLYYLFLSFLLSLRRRWSGGAMVLDNFQCRGSYNLDDSRARAYYTCSRCGWGLFGHFYSPLSFSPLSPSLWETARYRLKYCLKGPVNPKQPTNQHLPETAQFRLINTSSKSRKTTNNQPATKISVAYGYKGYWMICL